MNNQNEPIEWSAAKIIETNDKKRANGCFEKIQRVLKQHDCVIFPVVTIIGSEIKTEIRVQATPRKSPMGNIDVTGKEGVLKK